MVKDLYFSIFFNIEYIEIFTSIALAYTSKVVPCI